MKKKKLTDAQLAECAALKAIFDEKKEALGLTQEKVASMLGINQGSFSHYLNGRNALNLEFASKVAQILRVAVADFSERLASDIYALADVHSEVPGVLDLRKSLAYMRQLNTESSDEDHIIIAAKYYEGQWKVNPQGDESFINLSDESLFSTVDAGAGAHWHRVKGPSMTAAKTPSFPEGMMVLIRVETFQIETGKFYLVRAPDGSVTFKQIVIDSGRHYLVSLNPAFPPTELPEDWKIVGRAVDARMIEL